MSYNLYPREELSLLRARFAEYEICELHDHNGCPYLSAVLKPQYMGTSLPVLVTAVSMAELADRLHDDDLTERLRAAVCRLRDRGLLPEWHPPEGPRAA